MKRYVVEAIGTFFLVLTIGCTVIGTPQGIIAPLAIGSILMTMIYAGAHISGAHYNPAATLGIWLRGRVSTPHVIPYMLAQIVGALSAAAVVKYLKPANPLDPARLAAGPTFLVEFLFTFALVFVILNVATARSNVHNSFYGLAIGFTVLAGAFAVGSISGAAFNPAVTLGIASLGLLSLQNVPLYLAAQFLGGAVAAFLFNYLNPEDR